MPDLLVPADIARFVLAYAALIVAPGFAVAALLRPRSDALERLVFSIPCGYGLVVLCGLGTALAHIPFGLPTYLPCAVVVMGCASIRGGHGLILNNLTLKVNNLTLKGHGKIRSLKALDGRGQVRFRADPSGSVSSGTRVRVTPSDAGCKIRARGTRWAWIAAGVGLLQATLLLLSQRHDIPASSDVISHVVWTNLIARTHTFPIALLSSNTASGDGAFYPPAFHAVTALVLAAVPMPAYHAVIYSVLAVVFMLPLGLFCFVRTATGSARIGAFAALAALAFEPLPFFVGAEGLLTFVAAQAFVPALALALYEGLACGKRGAAVLAALIGTGLFYTHPTEFLTAGLLAATITFGPLRSTRAWERACLYGVGIVAAWLIAAAPALAAVHRTMAVGAQGEINATHDFTRPARVDIPADLHAYFQWIYGQDQGYLLLGAVLLGVVWCLARRRYLPLVAVQLLIAALALDSQSYNLLRPLYTLSFPWALWERIAATHYWFALPLAAIGIDAAVRFAGHLLRGKRASFIVMASTPVALFGLLLPLSVSAQRAVASSNAQQLTARDALDALSWLARHGSPRAVVVNDVAGTNGQPIDASMSLPILGGPIPLFAREGGAPGSLAARLYLLRHIADSPLPARAERYIRQYDVRYVFYGPATSRRARRHLDLHRLLASPHLSILYSSADGCRQADRGASRRCARSYVFGLEQPLASNSVARKGLPGA